MKKDNGKQKMEWYNMSGKDSKIPAEVTGTATLINAISFDRDQFDKCKTNQYLKRMTGHITNNSFSHFASIGDNIEKEITYQCFIIQLQNGKRALLWIDIDGNKTFKVFVKVQA
jgi:ribosomal protein L25 (general stress protein Ctc)